VSSLERALGASRGQLSRARALVQSWTALPQERRRFLELECDRLLRETILQDAGLSLATGRLLTKGLVAAALQPGALPTEAAAYRTAPSSRRVEERTSEESIAAFVAITGGSAATARRLLTRWRGHVDEAVASYFDSGGGGGGGGGGGAVEAHEMEAEAGREVACAASAVGAGADPWQALPDQLAACVLALLPAASLATACAASRRHRALLRDAAFERASRMAVTLVEHPHQAARLRLSLELELSNSLVMCAISASWCAACWQLRLMEAVAACRDAQLWPQPDEVPAAQAQGQSAAALDEVDVFLLSDAALLREARRHRGQLIVRRLVHGDASLAQLFGEVGALGPHPERVLPSQGSVKTAWRRNHVSGVPLQPPAC